MAERLQEPQDAVAVRGRSDQDGHDLTGTKLLGKIGEDFVARRLNVFEELLHQRVVVVGEALQHGEARLVAARRLARIELDHLALRLFAVDEGAVEREIDEADSDLVLPDRNLAQHERRLGGGLQQGQRVAHAHLRLVDLVEEKEARDAALFEVAEHDLQRRYLLFVRLGDDDRGVDPGDERLALVVELHRPGAIEEGEGLVHELGFGDVDLDAHRVGACLRRRIADRAPAPDRAGLVDSAGANENRFKQAGLAAGERADHREASRARSASIVAHVFSLPRRGLG